MKNSEKDQKTGKHRKTIYKETADWEDKKNEGESSSVSDIGRTDFISRPKRAHEPLGSSHEPGTIPGRSI